MKKLLKRNMFVYFFIVKHFDILHHTWKNRPLLEEESRKFGVQTWTKTGPMEPFIPFHIDENNCTTERRCCKWLKVGGGENNMKAITKPKLKG